MKFLKLEEGVIIKIEAISAIEFIAQERPFEGPFPMVEISVYGSPRPFRSTNMAVIKWASEYLDSQGVVDFSKTT
ncbi:MAG: hypothetical protein INR62_03210 [Rhodospirillales bacterium]|nr:hypothetical protein [Acetobacter sp.]